MAQPKDTNAKFKAIFDAIGDLRYGEMIRFAAGMRDMAVDHKLRRSDVHGWATLLQCAVECEGTAPDAP